MSKCRFIDEIRKLDIPGKAKAELSILFAKARRLAVAILRFLKAHRRFAEALLLGAIVAFLLTKIPLLGNFLALAALATSAAMGLARELREDLTRFFEEDIPEAAA